MTISRIPFVDLKAQYLIIKDELKLRFQKVLDRADFILGREVSEFEQAFADYCGVPYCVGVANGTDALVLALRAAGIGRGHEVITAANTFVATAEAIEHVGARPVLVDSHPDTYNMDVRNLEAAITSRTKAIVPVYLYGQPADMESMLKIAAHCGLLVIEDAAQAHGAQYRGRRAGSLGFVGCFSFYPSKNLGAYGDAGAIVTNDPIIAETLGKLRNHGGIEKYQHDVVGYNSRLDTLQAVVLNVKLKYLDGWNAQRRSHAAMYDGLLASVPNITPPKQAHDCLPVYHLYVIRAEDGSRDELRAYLTKRGIATGIHYPKPIHLLEAFQHLGYGAGDFPVAEMQSRTILSLPMYPELKESQIEEVVAAIGEFYDGRK